MSRLIDADALERDGWKMSRTVRVDKNTMEIQTRKPTDFPAIEPQRKRGKWIRSEDQMAEDIINGNYMFICSNCSHVDLHAKTVEVPYCWYCGADMRGKE